MPNFRLLPSGMGFLEICDLEVKLETISYEDLHLIRQRRLPEEDRSRNAALESGLNFQKSWPSTHSQRQYTFALLIGRRLVVRRSDMTILSFHYLCCDKERKGMKRQQASLENTTPRLESSVHCEIEDAQVTRTKTQAQQGSALPSEE